MFQTQDVVTAVEKAITAQGQCTKVSALDVNSAEAYLFKEYSSNTAVQWALEAKVH